MLQQLYWKGTNVMFSPGDSSFALWMFPYYKISGIFHIIVTEKFGQIWAELTVTLRKYLSQKPRIFNIFTCNYISKQRDEWYYHI